jgi:3-methylcrotonyl-CoA carboxylase alpha subunit
VRVETGVGEGDAISPFYDPMIAKLVTHGATRAEAIANLREMTARTECWPVKCNAGFLNLLLWDEDFEAGSVDTGLIARRLNEFFPDEQASDGVLQSVAHMVIDAALGGTAHDIRETYLTTDPGPASIRCFRLNRAPATPQVRLSDGRHDYDFTFADQSIDASLWVERIDSGYVVTEAGVTRVFNEQRGGGDAAAHSADGAILAPMPGKVIAVDVAAGEAVVKGQRLMVLEAMKMEHALTAPFDGTVSELAVNEGQQVQVEALLAKVEKVDT